MKHEAYLCLWIQGEKLLSAFVPVDLIQLVRLPDILQTHTVEDYQAQYVQYNVMTLKYIISFGI